LPRQTKPRQSLADSSEISSKRPSGVDLNWTAGLKKPAQGRSRETLKQLLAAAEAQLAQHGVHNVGVADIAAAAGFSTGAVYQRFKDKDALLEVMFDVFVEDARTSLTAAEHSNGPSNIKSVIEEQFASARALYQRHRGILGATIALADTHPRFREAGQNLFRQAGHILALHIARLMPNIGMARVQLAADFIVRLHTAFLDQNLIYPSGLPMESKLSEAAFAAELEALCLIYLNSLCSNVDAEHSSALNI
jgi:AcrR family transcriptional regulator